MNGEPILLNQRERRMLMVGIDLETTGTDPSRAKICQFAAVSRCPGWLPEPGIESKFLVDPQCPIPESATKVHRLTDDMVRGVQSLAERAPALMELLGKCCQSGACIVGYNVRKYDLPLLFHALADLGFVFGAQPMVLDVLDLVSWYHRDLPSRKLEHVATNLGLPVESFDNRPFFDANVPPINPKIWENRAATFEEMKERAVESLRDMKQLADRARNGEPIPRPTEQAHDALSDVKAAFRILAAIRRRLDVPDTMAGDLNLLRLAQIAAVRVEAEYSQYKHYLYRCRESWSVESPPLRLGFGKHCGRLLSDILAEDPGYWRWLHDKIRPDMPVAAKQAMDETQQRQRQQKESAQ